MTEIWEWVDVDNVATTLDALRGSGGWLMPPFEIVESVTPISGVATEYVSMKSRDIDIPIRMVYTTRAALVSAWRTLGAALNPLRGTGKIRFTHADGTKRELYCKYRGGLPGADAIEALNWIKATLSFRAADPYWYATSPVVGTYTASTLATFFPFFPLRITSSTIFATTSVTNAGDAETWPVWTITGPGTNPNLRNLTTGKNLSMTLTLLAGEVLTIDTRPGYKTIVLAPSTNKFSTISSSSSLWSLAKGVNSIQIEMSGSTAGSQVVMSYYPRYLTQ